ncbi:hypothetical protein [Spongiactinospora rosea]|uniref:hypothetical protein n=1 Tax=Spongiactinospora rosea TaxID=2248750 RepID=UPI001313F8AA|nr:hypothetical protein [Spongiactinospora rosea]
MGDLDEVARHVAALPGADLAGGTPLEVAVDGLVHRYAVLPDPPPGEPRRAVPVVRAE